MNRPIIAKVSIHRGQPSHGPQTWPWWRLVKFSWVRLGQGISTSTGRGRRVWMYSRWKRSVLFDLYWRKSAELQALHQLAIDVAWFRDYGAKHPERDMAAQINRDLDKCIEIARTQQAHNKGGS